MEQESDCSSEELQKQKWLTKSEHAVNRQIISNAQWLIGFGWHKAVAWKIQGKSNFEVNKDKKNNIQKLN